MALGPTFLLPIKLPRHLTKTLMLAIFCFLCFSVPSYGADYKVRKLDNGITLITSHFPHAPLISTYVYFKAGSMTETKQTDGLTHLFEHLFLRTNALIPSHEAFKKRLRELGTWSNATTGADLLNYYFDGFPSVYFEEVTELAAAVARTITIDEKTLNNEIPIVLDEMDRALTHPYFASSITKSHILLGEDLYHTAWPIGTKRKTVAEATIKEMELLKNTLFAPANTTIFVIGQVEHDKAYEVIQKHFGSWKNPDGWKPPFIPKLPNITKTQRWNFSHLRNSNINLDFYFPAFSASENIEKTYIADVLIFLLKNKNSKFHKKFLETGKWLSGGYAYYTTNFNPVSLVQLSLKDNTVDETIPEVLEEIKLWAEEGYFSEQELESTKKMLAVEFQVNGDNWESFISSLTHYSISVDPSYYKNYLSGMLNVTLEDIRTFVKENLINKPYFLKVDYNSKDAKKWGVDLNGDAYFEEHLADDYKKPKSTQP